MSRPLTILTIAPPLERPVFGDDVRPHDFKGGEVSSVVRMELGDRPPEGLPPCAQCSGRAQIQTDDGRTYCTTCINELVDSVVNAPPLSCPLGIECPGSP